MAIGCCLPSAFPYVSISYYDSNFKCMYAFDFGLLCILCASRFFYFYLFKYALVINPIFLFMIDIIEVVFKSCPGVQCGEFISIDHRH